LRNVGKLFSLLGATSVASLFYLVPAVTALFAYLLFGERLDAVSFGLITVASAGADKVSACDQP
jgi:drug/metabolite transporter (DMT)-like permease